MNRLNLPIILHSCTQCSRSRGILNYFSNCSRCTYSISQSLGVLSSCLFLEVGLFGNIQFCVLAWLVKSPFTSSVAYSGIACSYYREALINSEWLIARSAIGYKSHYIMSRSRTPPLLDFYLGKQEHLSCFLWDIIKLWIFYSRCVMLAARFQVFRSDLYIYSQFLLSCPCMV